MITYKRLKFAREGGGCHRRHRAGPSLGNLRRAVAGTACLFALAAMHLLSPRLDTIDLSPKEAQ